MTIYGATWPVTSDVHPTATMGTTPFSFDRSDPLRPVRKQVRGGVCIGEHVEIFAHANVDRGIERDTVLHDYVKVDHFAHIGHDSIIGQGTVVCAHAVICGYVEVGEGCYIGAGAMIKPRLKIGAGAKIGMGAVVLCDVPAGEVWVGVPARCIRHRTVRWPGLVIPDIGHPSHCVNRGDLEHRLCNCGAFERLMVPGEVWAGNPARRI